MSDTLRSGLIRLAFENPSLRADLLSLIAKEAAGPSYKNYVEKKRKKGEKPLDEEAWQSRVMGKGEGEGKSEEKDEGKKDEGGGKSEKPKSEKPKASFKKNDRPKMESVMKKHELTDDDAAQVIQFSIDRPKKGKPQSPEELKRRFMQNAKPETKERMKNMSPADFMVMLRSILDQEEGVGKTASLRSGLIRLAFENPSLRGELLPLLEKHAGEMEAELEADADPISHDQNLPEHYYFNKGAAGKGESVEALIKQFASPKSKNQNKPEHYYGLPPKGKQASVKVARPLPPGVHLIEDLSVLGPNFRLVYRELGSDYLGSEQVPGYYLDLGGLLKLVVKTPKQSPAGEAQAKKVIAKLLSAIQAM